MSRPSIIPPEELGWDGPVRKAAKASNKRRAEQDVKKYLEIEAKLFYQQRKVTEADFAWLTSQIPDSNPYKADAIESLEHGTDSAEATKVFSRIFRNKLNIERHASYTSFVQYAFLQRIRAIRAMVDISPTRTLDGDVEIGRLDNSLSRMLPSEQRELKQMRERNIVQPATELPYIPERVSVWDRYIMRRQQHAEATVRIKKQRDVAVRDGGTHKSTLMSQSWSIYREAVTEIAELKLSAWDREMAKLRMKVSLELIESVGKTGYFALLEPNQALYVVDYMGRHLDKALDQNPMLDEADAKLMYHDRLRSVVMREVQRPDLAEIVTGPSPMEL